MSYWMSGLSVKQGRGIAVEGGGRRGLVDVGGEQCRYLVGRCGWLCENARVLGLRVTEN